MRMHPIQVLAPATRRVGARGLALLPAMVLAGCSWLPSMPSRDRVFDAITPYRIEVVQGNVVTQEMAAGIKPGLTRAQVRDQLGSPLLTDIFHNDRWDYVFSIRRQGAPYQQRKVTVLFDGDVVKSFEADPLPSEREFIASIDPRRSRPAPPPLALTDEQIAKLPPPPKPAASAPGDLPLGAVRTYPPLEAAQ